MIGATLLLWVLGDRWSIATALLFGPRWVLLLPVPVLVLAALLTRPGLLLLILTGLGITLGPAMGYRIGWRSWFRAGPGELRVITYNIDRDRTSSAVQIPRELERLAPDVMVFQECSATVAEGQYWPEGWNVRNDGTICLGQQVPRDPGDGPTRRYPLASSAGPAWCGSIGSRPPAVPSTSPRCIWKLPAKGSRGFATEVTSREWTPARWCATSAPTGSATGSRARAPMRSSRGDFNMPVESVIYRRYWDDCDNVFSEVGHGFGYTRVLKRFSVRIDHVLTCGGWSAVRAFVGPDLGSDHLPLVVDLKR